jgi:hypothetical protein
MSVLRQANLLGQGRVDVPHVRAIESSICADFDLLAGKIMAGSKPYVVSGFNVITLTTGVSASTITITTAGGVLLHPLASESGTIFVTPLNRADEVLSSTNPRVQGSFTANAVNFVGIDLRRSADNTTSDLVQFLDPNTNAEKPKSVPLARTLDYVIVISTQDFSSTPGIAPLAKITTDASNHVTAIEDARDLMFRLGAGGSVTNAFFTYAWPGGRTEVGDNSDFSSGDKAISSLRDWTMAIMTRLWEIGGGEHWYSPTADRNVKMTRAGLTFTNGDWFEWDGTNLHWKGLNFIFDNSTAYFNQVKDQVTNQTGLTNLAEGECIFVDIDRTTNRQGVTALTPVKTVLANLGTPAVAGSRYVIAARLNGLIFTRDAQFPVNATFSVATTVATGVVKLHQSSLTPTAPVVISDGDLNTAFGVPQLTANAAINLTPTTGTAITGTGAGTGDGVSGFGSATGNGLVGQGGATSGSALRLTKPNTSNVDPMARAMNFASKTRWMLDNMGFPLGAYATIREAWLSALTATSIPADVTTAFPAWTGSFANGGAASTIDAANYSAPFMHLLITTSNSSSAFIQTARNMFGIGNGTLEIALEFEIQRVNAGVTNQTIYAGIGPNVSLPTVNLSFIRFRSTGAGNWLAEVGNGAGSANVDTGVAPSATTQRMRIEFHSGGTGGFASNTARFFINGVLKATITDSDISFGGMATSGLAFGLAASGVTGNNQAINIGLVRCAWNVQDDTA